jgi:putative ABC transport system substrate-binding protein
VGTARKRFCPGSAGLGQAEDRRHRLLQYTPANRFHRPYFLTVVPVGVRDANDLEGAILKISSDNFQAMVVTHDGLFYVQRKRLADLALEKRLPAIAFASEQWEAGVLATYGPHVPSLYRRAGAFVDKILKGINPADLPVEQPTKFELLVNLRTAKAIGVTVPPTILTRADDVIES